MKKLGEIKLTRQPKRILIGVVVYVLMLCISVGAGFGLCYAYFSAKTDATGNITMGKLTIDYYNEAGTSLSSDLIVYSERDASQNLLVQNGTVMPGDILHIKGQVKNPNEESAIDSYALLKIEVTKTYDNSGSDVSYKDLSYFSLDGTRVVANSDGRYTVEPTLLNVGDSVSIDISYELVGNEIDNTYINKDVNVVMTLLGYQVDLVTEETYKNLGANTSIYGSVALQATHKLIGNEIDVWGDDTVASSSLLGDGTEESPYLISSVGDLLCLGANYTSSTYTGKYFRLTKHLDLNNKNWTPISNFYGNLDGDGYSILNLNIVMNDNSSNVWNVGLFGIITNATIKNLIIRDISIDIDFNTTGSGTYVYCGGLVGQIAQCSYAKIENCAVIGSSTVTNHIEITTLDDAWALYIGGLLGFGDVGYSGVVVENCYTMLNINISAKCRVYCGGLLARLVYGDQTYTYGIKNSYYVGNITIAETTSNTHIGLILSTNYVAGSNYEIENCFAISNSNYTLTKEDSYITKNVNNAYINSSSQDVMTKTGIEQTKIKLTRTNIKDLAILRDGLSWSLTEWKLDSGNENNGFARLRIEK